MWISPKKSFKYKRIGATQYKHISEFVSCQDGRKRIFYQARKKIGGKDFYVSAATAKKAALALDIKLIERGLPPVNILKPKIN